MRREERMDIPMEEGVSFSFSFSLDERDGDTDSAVGDRLIDEPLFNHYHIILLLK